MSEFFNEIMTGLNEAVAIEREELSGKRTIYEIEPLKKYDNQQIKTIRNSVNMTQALFADYVGVSPKTVEAWESGRNIPQGTAQRFLQLLQTDGKKILQDYNLVAVTMQK